MGASMVVFVLLTVVTIVLSTFLHESPMIIAERDHV
jgi:hypothetical protein